MLGMQVRCGNDRYLQPEEFPDAALAPFGLCAQHPGEFIEHAYDLDPVAVCTAARDARKALRNPPKSVEELLDVYQGMDLVMRTSQGNHSCIKMYTGGA